MSQPVRSHESNRKQVHKNNNNNNNALVYVTVLNFKVIKHTFLLNRQKEQFVYMLY